MNNERTRILITNDDGIHSEGIAALEEALREIGDVYVVAPESEMRWEEDTSELQTHCHRLCRLLL